ncbi:MAG: cation diffusion facilitator family transporter [Gammaproteobacteria bacterium]|nr:cation diffusion facilitator family transporter [Gammaproteobacteria bacterium]
MTESIRGIGKPAANSRTAVLLRRATMASVAVACVLIVFKAAAYFITGSVALLSSLVDSLLDSLASLINFFAVRQALVPADREHRFGHGKAEPLAGLGQAAFIAGSAVFLVVESVNRLVNPINVSHGSVGIAVMLVSLALTLLLVAYQRYVVRRTQSLAIKADSLHYASDIVLNLSVILALVLSAQLGLRVADPLFALGIAGYIIWSAVQIARQSLHQLMDHELPDADRARIMSVCRRHEAVRNVHELRTRASGMDIFIQLHLELDGNLPLLQAHRVADEVEQELRREFPNADVIIHEDPAGVEEGARHQERE